MTRRVRPLNASIVSERLELGDSERFDPVLATNVLLYYGALEQTLALRSIAAMLRQGGMLLTNDAVLELPDIPLHSQGYVNVIFSSRQGDGERMVWYVKTARALSRASSTVGGPPKPNIARSSHHSSLTPRL